MKEFNKFWVCEKDTGCAVSFASCCATGAETSWAALSMSHVRKEVGKDTLSSQDAIAARSSDSKASSGPPTPEKSLTKRSSGVSTLNNASIRARLSAASFEFLDSDDSDESALRFKLPCLRNPFCSGCSGPPHKVAASSSGQARNSGSVSGPGNARGVASALPLVAMITTVQRTHNEPNFFVMAQIWSQWLLARLADYCRFTMARQFLVESTQLKAVLFKDLFSRPFQISIISNDILKNCFFASSVSGWNFEAGF